MSFHKITSRDNPELIARRAAIHEEHLREALKIALRRASRSKPVVRRLLHAATVEGLAAKLNGKVSAVSFLVPELGQTWHQLIPWSTLDGEPPTSTATLIAWSLRENIRLNKSALRGEK